MTDYIKNSNETTGFLISEDVIATWESIFRVKVKCGENTITPETCEDFEKNEDACDTCENWNCCWGESPWGAARAELDRSR